MLKLESALVVRCPACSETTTFGRSATQQGGLIPGSHYHNSVVGCGNPTCDLSIVVTPLVGYYRPAGHTDRLLAATAAEAV